MRWVTRARPKVDRIACVWLIRKFIDPEAEIVYAPPEDVLALGGADGAVSFDAKGATFSHRRQADGWEWCTFETLIAEHGLSDDAALAELALIVHAADVASDVDTHPFGAALRAIGDAGGAVESDDYRLLERGLFVYDALYEHCRRLTSVAAG